MSGLLRCAPLLVTLLLCASLWGCGASPAPPQMTPLQGPTQPDAHATQRATLTDEACLESTRVFYKRAWGSIEDYLREIKPLLSYLSALDTDQVGQRLHRAHYLAEFQEQVFQRFRLMERITDRCEAARPTLLRYRGELIIKLSELM